LTFERFLALVPIFFREGLDTLFAFLPYFLAGIMLGELLKFASWTKTIYKWVSRSPVKSVVMASCIGIISPLCTYGTIPIVIELYKSKVHVAPIVAFLASSALMNPQLFVMTFFGIGPDMAIARIIAVFVFSVATGLLVYAVPKRFIVRKSITHYDDGEDKILNREKKSLVVKQYFLNCLKTLKGVGAFLVIGVLMGAAVVVFIPDDLLIYLFRAGRMRSVFVGALVGLPMNTCGGGVIAFVNAMIANGMGIGTALAFFLVGPATRPAPLMAMATLFTPLFLIGYCLLLFFSAVLMGMGLEMLLEVLGNIAN